MGAPHIRSNGAAGPRPQLPAFCRSRRPIITVNVSSLSALRNLVLLVLLFQLSTLLLVIAGPVPPRLSPARSTNDFRPDTGTDVGGPFTVTLSSGR